MNNKSQFRILDANLKQINGGAWMSNGTVTEITPDAIIITESKSGKKYTSNIPPFVVGEPVCFTTDSLVGSEDIAYAVRKGNCWKNCILSIYQRLTSINRKGKYKESNLVKW